MATNLANAEDIGLNNACVFRVATLDATCTPVGGVDGGLVTAGIVTMTATPDIEEGAVIEPKNGCGQIAYTIEEEDVIKRYNLSGEFIFFDWEMFVTLFGGELVHGAAGGDFAGRVIGWAAPKYNAPSRNGVYLEIITDSVAAGAGSCVVGGAARPVAYGHIFGKVKAVPGERTFENAEARALFTGKATNNPNLYDGPWNDFPGEGYVNDSPLVVVGYSQDQYDAILAEVTTGFVDLPTAS